MVKMEGKLLGLDWIREKFESIIQVLPMISMVFFVWFGLNAGSFDALIFITIGGLLFTILAFGLIAEFLCMGRDIKATRLLLTELVEMNKNESSLEYV